MNKETKIQILCLLGTLIIAMFNFHAADVIEEKEKTLGEAYNMMEDSLAELRTTKEMIDENILYLNHIYTTAEEYGVPPEVVIAIMKVESSFDPTAENRRCYGLMQVHDVHCETFNVETEELLDLRRNSTIGISLLSDLMENSSSLDEVLGKYNMGETGYERWCNNTGNSVTAYAEKVQDILEKWKEK